MQVWHKSARVWDGPTAFSFAVSICFVCCAFCIAGWFGPDYGVTIGAFHIAFETRSIFLTAAALVPAIYCFAAYPESRSSLLKLDAGWRVYLVAVAAGLILPFTSYLGTRHPELPWGREAAMNIARLFAWNLFLGPLWEEIVWRGCFQNKVRLFCSPSSGILLTSIGFTLCHGGKIAILYSGGIPIEALCVLPFIYFCLGIILGSVFEMGRESLWPCVILHASFNAATEVYAQSYNRSSELGSYVAELVIVAIAAGYFLRGAIRQSRATT